MAERPCVPCLTLPAGRSHSIFQRTFRGDAATTLPLNTLPTAHSSHPASKLGHQAGNVASKKPSGLKPQIKLAVAAAACSIATVRRSRHARGGSVQHPLRNASGGPSALCAKALPHSALPAPPPPSLKGAALLAFTIALEVFASCAMKLAQRNKLWMIGTYLGYGVCFAVFEHVLKYWPISIAYAIWSGAGTAAMAFIGRAFFAEPLGMRRIFSIALITLGVVGLNVS